MSCYKKIIKKYEANKDKKWDEWLSVKTIFKKSGKQGLIGLFETKEPSRDTQRDPQEEIIFKISFYTNYLIHHEISVMEALIPLSKYCHNFVKMIGNITCLIDSSQMKTGNPFIQNKHSTEKEVLLLEHITDSKKLYNYIKCDEYPLKNIFSMIKQTLLAVSLAQKKAKLTHYDLHSNNIMVKKCSRKVVFLYILNETDQFAVASNGYYPVIIDFGFSYSKSCDNNPMYASMNHTDVGFTSNYFDPISDPKLFLVSISHELCDNVEDDQVKKFRNIVLNTFSPLEIEWDCGWDTYTKNCVGYCILERTKKVQKISKFFEEYHCFIIDILQTMVILPLQKRKKIFEDECELYFKTFFTEFKKIEDQIGSYFYCLFILKSIVDIARDVRTDYYSPIEEAKKNSVFYFKKLICERVDSFAKYCNLKKVNFEKLLCSVFCIGDSIEGIFYKEIKKIQKRNKKLYKKLPLSNIDEIYSVLDINIPDEFVYKSDTVIVAIDGVNETVKEFQLSPEEIEKVNSTDSVCRGEVLYKFYTN